jgi:polysaccharide deacetylase 2 family uncharacterized protein YibQ
MTRQPTDTILPSSPVWSKRILCGLLLVCIGGVTHIMLTRGERAASAYTQGQYVRIDVHRGVVDGKISLAAPTTPVLSPAQEKAAYRQQRIRETLAKQQAQSASATEASGSDTPPSTEAAPASPPPSPSKLPFVKPNFRKLLSPLASAPNPALIEKSPDGDLPRISADGATIPWKYYAKPYVRPKGTRMLSIVITNLGLNPAITKQAFGLDERVTLAFSPYAIKPAEQVEAARRSGFETWMMLPLEHENYPVHDYGPLSLLVEETSDHNIKNLNHILARASGIVGVLALPDEHFSHDPQMISIASLLAQRGILLGLYDRTFARNNVVSKSTPILPLRPHIHGGNLPSTTEDLFRQIETDVNTRGQSIVTIAAMPAMLDALNAWIKTLSERNIALVPLSAHAIESTNKITSEQEAEKSEENE